MPGKLSHSPAAPGGTKSRLLREDEALVALLTLEGGHVGPELAGVAAPCACALKAPPVSYTHLTLPTILLV